MQNSCNWEHTLLYFNGNHRIHTHDWQWSGHHGNYGDISATMTYALGANQQFWARVWNGCWSNWHTSEPDAPRPVPIFSCHARAQAQ